MEMGDGVTQSDGYDVINQQDAAVNEDLEIIGTNKELAGDESFEILPLSKDENNESLEIVEDCSAKSANICEQETLGVAKETSDVQPDLLEEVGVETSSDKAIINTEEQSLIVKVLSNTVEKDNTNESVDQTKEAILSKTEEVVNPCQ